ncbi:MAG TPA: PGPGW domain-containing protein [Streptosporangiaceae bacterium]|nr:PGPGW domain-containing protein [Streptosporangiaceae bacterium]
MTDLVRLLRRIAVTVVGTVVLAVGVVLLVAPGPGILAIFLALAIFAAEYEWARRRLGDVRDLAKTAAEKTATSQVAKSTAILCGVGAVGLGGVLIFTEILPFSGIGAGLSIALAGLIVLATTVYSIRDFRRTRSVTSRNADREIGIITQVFVDHPGEIPPRG